MEYRVVSKLSDAMKNNESRWFSEILTDNLTDIQDLIGDGRLNIYHELAMCDTHEKYLGTFLEKLNHAIKEHFSLKEIELLLNMTVITDDQATPLHMAIIRGKAVIDI